MEFSVEISDDSDENDEPFAARAALVEPVSQTIKRRELERKVSRRRRGAFFTVCQTPTTTSPLRQVKGCVLKMLS